MAKNLLLHRDPEDDPIDLVREFFKSGPADSHDRFWSIYPRISDFSPSLGYAHLANLVKQGFIGLILTTNWDPLLELSLSRVLRPDQYRVLIRGELTDDTAARSLRISSIPKILKLHGDLSARFFHVTDDEMPHLSDKLRDAILHAASTELLVVGSSLEDPDIAGLLMNGPISANLYYINPVVPQTGSTAHTVLRSRKHISITGKYGEFDEFFTELDLAVQGEMLSYPSQNGLTIQREIIAALERGAPAISYQKVAQYVDDFSRKILSHYPDIVAYVDDPLAPGGTEIRRRLQKTKIGMLPQINISILNDSDNRVLNRRASLTGVKPSDEAIRIVLVDSVTFSGNTLKLAVEELKRYFPMAAIIPSALVVSLQLKQRSGSGNEPWLEKLTYQQQTDRHEITFPWGSTFSTGTIDRSIAYGNPPRTIRIFRSPWGCGEIFVDQENCSVRILTVESGQKLSFQRHLCRDELFVALDDETGFDISGHDFHDEKIGNFDSRIESVSLSKGDYLLVPRGIWHRARALRTRVRLLEIGLGIYDEDRDIERLLDEYGRSE